LKFVVSPTPITGAKLMCPFGIVNGCSIELIGPDEIPCLPLRVAEATRKDEQE
jgi:hypothetical protein